MTARTLIAILTIGGLIFSRGNALADEPSTGRWLYLGENGSGTPVSVDKETIVKNDGRVTVWLKFSITDATRSSSMKPTTTEVKVRARYKCEEMTVTTLAVEQHDNLGRSLSSVQLSSPEEKAIPPDSVNEVVWRGLCTQ